MSVRETAYWSSRQGRGPKANPTINDLARAITLAVEEQGERDHLQEWFGYWCVDAHDVPGRAGLDAAVHIERVLGYRDAWPLPEPLYDDAFLRRLPQDELAQMEDRLFDLIEFFHDHVSSGIERTGLYHDYSDCGWHFREFDPAPAQNLFRSRLNATLRHYRSGFLINTEGEIEHGGPDGLNTLLDTPLRTSDTDVRSRVAAAIATYRHRNRTPADQRDAVRNLFDVLEKLRPQVKQEMLSGDASDLFRIANNFSIRHLNESQKGNYDSDVWYSWMFYVNLATIQLITRIISKRDSGTRG